MKRLFTFINIYIYMYIYVCMKLDIGVLWYSITYTSPNLRLSNLSSSVPKCCQLMDVLLCKINFPHLPSGVFPYESLLSWYGRLNISCKMHCATIFRDRFTLNYHHVNWKILWSYFAHQFHDKDCEMDCLSSDLQWVPLIITTVIVEPSSYLYSPVTFVHLKVSKIHTVIT